MIYELPLNMGYVTPKAVVTWKLFKVIIIGERFAFAIFGGSDKMGRVVTGISMTESHSCCI
jgi:hypothetical protein